MAIFNGFLNRFQTEAGAENYTPSQPGTVSAPAANPWQNALDTVGTGLAPTTPPAVQNVLNDFNAPTAPPSDFFTGNPSLPVAIQNAVDTLTPSGGNLSGDTTVRPETFLPSVTSQPSAVAPGPANITIAPSQTTTNILDIVQNFFFPPVNNVSTTSVNAPMSGTSGVTGDMPSVSPSVDASLGSVVTPTTQAHGQTVDTARTAPSGIPTQVAATIRGLNLPGVSAVKSDWGVIALVVLVPTAILGAVWVLGKVLRRG